MIYRVALVHIFGRGSGWKLFGLYIAASVLSLLLASGLGQLDSVYAFPKLRVAATVFVTAQAATLFVLFAASGTLRSFGTFEQILVHWPVMPRVRWLTLMLPAAILASLTIVLIGFPLGVVAASMGLSVGLYFIALVLGGVVSFCGYWALKGHRLLIQQMLGLVLLALEYKSIPFIAHEELPIRSLTVAVWIMGLVTVVKLFATSRHSLVQDVTRKRESHTVRTTGFTRVWFGKKVLRRQSLLVNFMTTIMLSSGIALICSRHSEYSVFGGLMSGLLGATIAADVRSVARKKSPAEIAGIKGTAYFLLNHLSAAGVVAMAATLPLILLNPAQMDTYTQLCIGISAGIFAGTLLVPAPRDIAAQCVATLICICLLLVPDHLALPGQPTALTYSVGQITTALLLLLASAGIEYKRNNYQWRYHAA